MKKKEVKKIEIKVENGIMRFETKGFSDFEIIGVLSYYQDWLKIHKIQNDNPSGVVS